MKNKKKDTFFKKSKGVSNIFFDSPEDRVKAFIHHWYQQWSKAKKKMGKEVDFDIWEHLVSEVDGTHFVAGKSCGSKNSFGSTADYSPQVEKITDCDIHGSFAQVFTESYEEALNSTVYHVYELKSETESGWKITQILTLFHPPQSPVINIDKHADVLAMSRSDAAFMARAEYLELNENTLFQAERKLKISDLEEGATKLTRLGKLQICSGVLGILDFGYDIYHFEPLQIKVLPGSYPVETVAIHNRVAGIRVKFREDEQAVRWYAANTPTGNGIYDVNAGNLAIFDVGNLLGLSRLKKEMLFNKWCLSGQPELVSMTDTNDCVITDSGFGDGAYPAFWGVNEQDEVISLYIDFMILVQEDENGSYQSI